jgi:CelD/BcsL family acetyltransferase involved in cellulose biosynthesis
MRSTSCVRDAIEHPAPKKGLRILEPVTTQEHIVALEAPESVEHPVETRVYYSWTELKAILPAWEELLRENRALSIFSTPEWLGSWWEAFGGGRRLVALAFFSDCGTILGMVPLYEDRMVGATFPRWRCLRFVGDGSMDSDNLDLILRPGFERECCSALLQWLASHRGWDLCCLDTLPGDSIGAQELRQQLAARKWPVLRRESQNAAISLPATWQSYLQSLTSAFRPLVTRYPRRLSSRFTVRVYRWEERDRVPEALELLFGLHQKRWNRANEPGAFGSPQRREFYRHIAGAFLEKGWLEFWFLELDGRAVATQFCFRYRETVYLLQEGFDPDFAADKVGYALRAAMLRYFVETGATRYDFLGGFSTHKRNWGAQPGAYQNLCFAAPRSLGSCHIALNKWGTQGKEWLRQHLPSAAWRTLHAVKSSVTGGGRNGH